MTRRSVAVGRGYFGVGIYRPKTPENLGTLWRAAHLYGAAFIFTIGHRYHRQASDTTKAWRSVPLMAYANFEAFNEARPFDAPLVGVELADRARTLPDFTHPQRAVYLLGAEDDGLPPWLQEKCQHLIQIPCAAPWSMNVAMSGSIVLYDRHIKAGSLAVSA